MLLEGCVFLLFVTWIYLFFPIHNFMQNNSKVTVRRKFK